MRTEVTTNALAKSTSNHEKQLAGAVVELTPLQSFTLVEFAVELKKRLLPPGETPLPITIEAKVKVQIGDTHQHVVAEGNGPVNALDHALRKALIPTYPEIERVHLSDYGVTILNPEEATAALTRVNIEASYGEERWSTIGVSTDIVEASIYALAESYDTFLRMHNVTSRPSTPLLP